MNTILFVCILTGLIHFSETTALAMRLAGVRTKQVASSISFVNTAFLGARLSNMLQAPLLGVMVDTAVRNKDVLTLGNGLRYVILAAFIGNLIGAFFIPTMVRVFEKGINVFSHTGSLPAVFFRLLKPRNLVALIKCFRLPSFKQLEGIHWSRIPHSFIYLNILMVSVYAIGVLSSLYAGAHLPDLRATAVQLSGIVNGLATIMLVIFVDPTGAHIVDQIVHRKRPESDAKTMIFMLVLGRVIGTLILSQLFFIPATQYIMKATIWMGHSFAR